MARKTHNEKTNDVQKNIINAIINHDLKPQYIDYSKIIRNGKGDTQNKTT